MYGQPFPEIDTIQDISLVGYDPTLDYEQENMDNYRRASLFDNGAEEISMMNDDFGPQERAMMAQDRIHRTYDSFDPVRKSGVDLNDYGMDFHLNEDIGTIQQGFVKQNFKRFEDTQYFQNDSAKQVPIGQVAPARQNKTLYDSTLNALMLRQDFVRETEDKRGLRSFKPLAKKKKLNYDPSRCMAAENAFNDYVSDVTATTGRMYRGKVKQMAAIFKSLDAAQFAGDEMMDILRGSRCLKQKNSTKLGQLDGDLADNGEDNIKNAFVKIRKARANRKNANNVTSEFDDSLERITAVSNIINKKAQERSRMNSRDPNAVLTEFDDVVLDPVTKVHQGQDALSKFVRHSQDSEIPDDVMESAVKSVRNESRKLSKFYHNVQAGGHEYDPDDLGIFEVTPSSQVTTAKFDNRRLQNSDAVDFEENYESKVQKKSFFKYDTQKLKKAAAGSDNNYFDEVQNGDPRGLKASIQNARNQEKFKVYRYANKDSAEGHVYRTNGKIHARRSAGSQEDVMAN